MGVYYIVSCCMLTVPHTRAHLLQNKVELCLRLVHLVSLQQTEVGSPQKVVRVIHDDLVCRGVEEGCLRGREGGLLYIFVC